MAATEACVKCRGTGKNVVEVHEIKNGARTHTHDFETECLWCKGSGQRPLGTAEALRKHDAEFWCHCPGERGETYYVPDNERADCRQHHWRCMKCRKVVQVG